MQQFLASLQDTLQSTAFITWVRETNSVLVYPTILAAHTFGMAFLVGLSAVIALRILGFAPALPLAPLERFFPLIWLGFWVNAVSGLVLLSLTPADFLTKPVFYIKLLAIAGAVVSVRWLRITAFGDPTRVPTKSVPMKGRILAGTSLAFWVVGVTAGRLVSYSGFTQWRTAIAVLILAALLLAGYNGARRFRPSNKAARQAAHAA